MIAKTIQKISKTQSELFKHTYFVNIYTLEYAYVQWEVVLY